MNARTRGAIRSLDGSAGRTTLSPFHRRQQILGVDERSDLHEEFDDCSGPRRMQGGLHFHRFDRENDVSDVDLLADPNGNRRNRARHGRRNLAFVPTLGRRRTVRTTRDERFGTVTTRG
jgi:hypothetical protein